MSKGRWGSESPNLHPTRKSNPSCRSMLSEQRMRVWHDGSCSLETRLLACKANKHHDWKENRETGEWFANEHGPTKGWSTALRMSSKPEQGMGPGVLACVPPLLTRWCTRKETGRKAAACWTQLALLLHFFYFSEHTGHPKLRSCCIISYFVVLPGDVAGRRQMTAKLPNWEFTLLLEAENPSKAIRERFIRGTCTMRCHPGIFVAMRSGGRCLLEHRQWRFAVSFWEGGGAAGTRWHPSWGQLRGSLWLCASSAGSWSAYHLLWYAVNNQKGILPGWV